MPSIKIRTITPEDRGFLTQVYAATRNDVLALVGWTVGQKEDFLRSQFELQHSQWLENYPDASFDLILVDDAPAGRLYVDRRENEIRIIDIALLPAFRRLGIGSKLLGDLIAEADRKALPLTLHVEFDNPILGYYERLGFEKKGTFGVYQFMERVPDRRSSPELHLTGQDSAFARE